MTCTLRHPLHILHKNSLTGVQWPNLLHSTAHTFTSKPTSTTILRYYKFLSKSITQLEKKKLKHHQKEWEVIYDYLFFWYPIMLNRDLHYHRWIPTKTSTMMKLTSLQHCQCFSLFHNNVTIFSPIDGYFVFSKDNGIATMDSPNISLNGVFCLLVCRRLLWVNSKVWSSRTFFCMKRTIYEKKCFNFLIYLFSGSISLRIVSCWQCRFDSSVLYNFVWSPNCL